MKDFDIAGQIKQIEAQIEELTREINARSVDRERLIGALQMFGALRDGGATVQVPEAAPHNGVEAAA